MIALDYLTILIATIISMILAFLWYSPIFFGNIWLRLAKVEKCKMHWSKVAFSFVNTYIQALFLAIVEGYFAATSFWDGVIVGFIVWLGFIATTQLSGILWAKKSFKLYLLDNGFWVLSYMIMGGILAG